VDNSSIGIWEVEPGRECRQLPQDGRLWHAQFSPDGKLFATATWHGTGVKVWMADTGQPIQELAVAGSATCSFSPDGEWLVTVSAAEYRFWKVRSWLAGLPIPRDRAGDMPGDMAFTPDGRTLALLRGRNTGVTLVLFPGTLRPRRTLELSWRFFCPNAPQTGAARSWPGGIFSSKGAPGASGQATGGSVVAWEWATGGAAGRSAAPGHPVCM
jgi:WD40 repeat protein